MPLCSNLAKLPLEHVPVWQAPITIIWGKLAELYRS